MNEPILFIAPDPDDDPGEDPFIDQDVDERLTRELEVRLDLCNEAGLTAEQADRVLMALLRDEISFVRLVR